MNDLMDAKDVELFWEQPKGLRRSFILTSGEEIYGKLDFKTEFSTLAEATSGSEKWTFKRVGWLSTHITIRRANSVGDIGIVHPKWTGTEGEIQLPTGQIFFWKVANFWATRFAILTSDGQEIITYSSGAKDRKILNFFKQQARVVIAPEAWQIKALTLLLLLGWYLVVLHHEDAGAAASITSVVGLY